jgi:hypothetical protein
MIIMWDSAPIHRRQITKEFLPNAAAQRLHVERLLTYALDLHPGEGLWEQLKGSSSAMRAASTFRSCGMSYVTRSHESGEHHACFTASFGRQNFQS